MSWLITGSCEYCGKRCSREEETREKEGCPNIVSISTPYRVVNVCENCGTNIRNRIEEQYKNWALGITKK